MAHPRKCEIYFKTKRVEEKKANPRSDGKPGVFESAKMIILKYAAVRRLLAGYLAEASLNPALPGGVRYDRVNLWLAGL
jgi:hypothetical protein